MCESGFSLLQRRFQDAIADLWWTSETDAPFELRYWPDAFAQGFSLDELLSLANLDANLPRTKISIEQLFEPATQEQDWHGEEEKLEAGRFRKLKDLVLLSLSELNVFKVGEVDITIFIVGKTQTGQWLVLSTQAVET